MAAALLSLTVTVVMAVVDGGNSGCQQRRQQGTGRGGRWHEDECKANEGDRVRADKGTRARGRVD